MGGRPELPILVEAILAVEDLIMEQAERTQAPTHPYIRSDRVEGTAVYAADGSRIGTIKYLEIEKVSGQVVYAITSFNSFLAVRADTHTIPWSRLTYDPHLMQQSQHRHQAQESRECRALVQHAPV